MATQLTIVALAVNAPDARAASTGTGDGVSYTLEGCRNNGGIILPDGSGHFVCADAAYTTGNLGKGWNELDLVPIRFTLQAGNSAPATQDYAFALAVDNEDAGHPGYDVLSSDSGGTPVLNAALSSGSCGSLTASDEAYATPGVGGTDTTLYRTMSVTGQGKNSTCVYDAYARLALGSHLYPGSSLHFNLLNTNLEAAGVGSKDVSIPVKEILPQELRKDMTATQGSDHVWNVAKNPSPASLTFTNTCDPTAPLSKTVGITVTWTRQAATPSGDVTVITHVYAKNPASRVITVNVTDVIRSGTTVLDIASATGVDVPANTELLVLSHQTTVPAGTTDLNDIATAIYTDKATGVPVPGTTQATASATVQLTGPETNQSAVISDVESITGAGLTFSVDSFTGASGAFDGGYIAGTKTVEPVSWTSGSQSSSGSVTFNKTVYATAASILTGSLSDTATLTGSDGFTTSASASVGLSLNATVGLGISKTTALKIASDQTFTFHLFDATTDPATDLSKSVSVTVPKNTNGPELSDLATGLSPDGEYFFHEDAVEPYPAQDSSHVLFDLVPGDASSCTRTIDVANNAAPAKAQVAKMTDPASTGLWTFTLTGPGGLSETITDVQATGVTATPTYFPFASALEVDGGVYTITETQQADYDLTAISGDFAGDSGRVSTDTTARTCSFTLNLATDSAQILQCAFTNTLRGHIIINKKTFPAGGGPFTFDPSYGTSFQLNDGDSNNSGALVPGTYSVSEQAKAGWDLTGTSCDDGSPVSAISLQPGEVVTCTFTNTQRGAIIVKKVTNPTTATDKFAFTGDASGSIGNGEEIVVGNLVPGTYTSAETVPTGWDLTSIACDDGSSATPSTVIVTTGTATFKVDPGEVVTCTFTNTERGHVKVVKTVSGAAPSGSQAFTFQLRSGASASAAGTILESATANAANGGVLNFTTALVPGQTYQICEQLMPGWDNNFAQSYTAYNPSGDNSVLCADFTVDPGQTKTISVDNTLQGGLALTIGFWKNWASCAKSNGKQKYVLDQTLLAASVAGFPITVGMLVLDPNVLGASTACQDAVNMLNKTTIDGKKKMASDPLYNMAAQLLAADLNVQAGAGTCPASTTAMSQAQALLVKYGWNGLAYSPKLSAADAALANSLNTTLDHYNNNLLC